MKDNGFFAVFGSGGSSGGGTDTLQDVMDRGSTYSGSSFVDIDTSSFFSLKAQDASNYGGAVLLAPYAGAGTGGVVLTYGTASGSKELSVSGNVNGILVNDGIDSIGMGYNSDYATNGISSFGDRWITDKGYSDSYIGGNAVNALVKAPTVTQDGYAITWNDTNSEYELTSVGNSFGTDNQIPYVNAGGTDYDYGDLYFNGTELSIGIAPLGSSRLTIFNSTRENGIQITNAYTSANARGIISTVNGSNANKNFGFYADVSNGGAGNAIGYFAEAGGSGGAPSVDAGFAVTSGFGSGLIYGVYSSLTSSNTGNNIAGRFEASNAGAGNAYALQLVDGTEAVDYVWTCVDANGNGQWKVAASGGAWTEEATKGIYYNTASEVVAIGTTATYGHDTADSKLTIYGDSTVTDLLNIRDDSGNEAVRVRRSHRRLWTYDLHVGGTYSAPLYDFGLTGRMVINGTDAEVDLRNGTGSTRAEMLMVSDHGTLRLFNNAASQTWNIGSQSGNNYDNSGLNFTFGSTSGSARVNVYTTGSTAGTSAIYVENGNTDAIFEVKNDGTVEANGQDVLQETLIVACSDENTDLTTGTAKVTFRMPYAMTVTKVKASVTTAPTGSTLTCDINESGVSILSTIISIDAGEKTSETAATPPVISDSALADDAEMTIDIDQIGSTVAGTGLKVYITGIRG